MSSSLEAHNLFRHRPNMRLADAVAALIVLEDGRYVMQLRDDKPGVFYPGHWGLFGGAIDEGEDPEAALRRELIEELELRPTSLSYFSRMDFDYRTLGSERCFRLFYEVPIRQTEFESLVLGEGERVAAFTAPDLLLTQRVTPYDSFQIWLHYMRGSFAPDIRGS